MCSLPPPPPIQTEHFPSPLSKLIRNFYEGEKNRRNKKFCDRKLLDVIVQTLAAELNTFDVNCSPKVLWTRTWGVSVSNTRFYQSLHNLIHRRLHFSRSSTHNPLDANPSRNIFQLGSEDLTFPRREYKKHLSACSTFSSTAQPPHCSVRCEACGKSSADGKRTNQYKRSTVGYASEAARKGKFQWIFFPAFHASIFVCQFTQIDASPLIADCDGIFADSRGNSVENLKVFLFLRRDRAFKRSEKTFFSRKWSLNWSVSRIVPRLSEREKSPSLPSTEPSEK